MTEEERRLQQTRDGKAAWKRWGPYLAERAWGTVREDYSADGSAWTYFPHDHARSRVYRWNEDGLAGISDDRQLLCFSLAFWNGQDPILKERLFGLSGPEGNHGEDVKECYFYLDSTPTHSYMKCLYKYPQRRFPYPELVEENHRRGKEAPEYELLDTGAFAEDRYFDIEIEYAKASTDDIMVVISATNRGPDPAELHVLPTLWFRNTWSWGTWNATPGAPETPRPALRKGPERQLQDGVLVEAAHPVLGTYWLHCHVQDSGPELLFTENETNVARVFPGSGANPIRYVKDAFHDYVVFGDREAVNPALTGTKMAARYRLTLGPGETRRVCCRLSRLAVQTEAFGPPFEEIVAARRAEADAFFATVVPEGLGEDARRVQRQALAGMLWSKQFYHYNVSKWLSGDPDQPAPPAQRREGRNRPWLHLDSASVMSMPDKWEYPWFAAWDLGFHCVPLALVDSDFAKEQLLLLLREWYMHPSGKLPAYEWAFDDVNPPVHAWAARRVFQIERRMRGKGDVKFLERVFHKLLLNFTWWVNRKDEEGNNIFEGGFLGLDNIGIFDRSAPLPTGGLLEQADGTSWMAFYCLNMLAIALELAREDPSYEDLATKFLEHFFYIAHAMNDRPTCCGDGATDLWDEDDGFYYDVLRLPDKTSLFLRVRSLVGLIPLLAVETLDEDLLHKLRDFRSRMEWFLEHKPDLCTSIASVERVGEGRRRLFSVVNEDRLRRLLSRMLDETEFLSPHGIRAVSRFHLKHPFQLEVKGVGYQVDYEPAESTSGLFGGNSNWRGPIWFPINYLLIEALQKFDYYYGPDFKIECPTGSGNQMTLWEVTTELSCRLIRLFLRDENGRRPIYGGTERFQTDPHWRDWILFHEYFHGDNGAGLGASHQTGWTGLVAKLIQQSGGANI